MKKGAALLERMVHGGTVCLRRLGCGQRRDEVRFNRFLANEKVTVARLLAGWGAAAEAAVGGRHVLAIQDTSEIGFRTRGERRRGLGEIGKGVGRGILLHAMIGIDAASKACLGLLAGDIWTRSGRAAVPHGKRPLSDKESRRWIDTAAAGRAVLASAARITMVADREADFYAFWAQVPTSGPAPRVDVIGRCYQDRPLVGGGTLLTAARDWPVADTRVVALPARAGQPAREARLQLRHGAVTLKRPRHPGVAGLPDQVRLCLVEVAETDPPEGIEPICWHLLTTHGVEDPAGAWQIVDWYRARWIIEQFFRLLKKQGLRLEDSQIDTAERLLKMVAIAARAAAVTLQMLQARDAPGSDPAVLALSEDEVSTLAALEPYYHSTRPLQQNPHPHRTLAWAAWLVARLGGWDGYPSSRPPGPITFKNGLDALRNLARGWALRNVCMP